MAEEILPGIFRIVVPIPNSPLKATNAYLIRGKERNLLVDTGQNRAESLTEMHKGLSELSIDMRDTDIFLTHMHADHSGLIPFLKTDNTRIYASVSASESVNFMLTADSPMERLYQAACRNGFSPLEARTAIQRHPGSDSGTHQAMDFAIVADEQVIEVGAYRFTCVATPGHTQGHFCLYEPVKKILFSGDHILGDISPNITHYIGDDDPLADFLNSLRKVAKLEVGMLLPGHRRIFTDCRGRINELLQHHQRRVEEALSILESGPMTGYEVAARMTWDMVYRTWESVAPAQKYFATGEALAHIHFLEHQGLVKRIDHADLTLYDRC